MFTTYVVEAREQRDAYDNISVHMRKDVVRTILYPSDGEMNKEGQRVLVPSTISRTSRIYTGYETRFKAVKNDVNVLHIRVCS